jgi:hypothetical protein
VHAGACLRYQLAQRLDDLRGLLDLLERWEGERLGGELVLGIGQGFAGLIVQVVGQFGLRGRV